MSGESEPEWVEIQIGVTAADAAEVAGMLADVVGAAAMGTELRPDCIVFWVPAPEAPRTLAETRDAVAILAARGASVDPRQVRMQAAAPEGEWRDAWKRYFHVTHITPRIVIVPSWEAYMPGRDDVVLEIDPGRAFGTGAHVSTRLCLAELDRLADPDPFPAAEPPWVMRRFLDCGTGSGILSIAAAKLWPASSGLAVDVDPEAVEVAVENCQRNGVDHRVACAPTPAGMVRGRFDLVLANIERGPLLVLRHALVTRLAAGGVLILSGLLRDEVGEVAEAYRAAAPLQTVRISGSDADREWGALVLRSVRG